MRRDLILYLEDGPRTLSEIRDHLQVGSPQLSTKIRELLEYDLIQADRKTYGLTMKSRILLKTYKQFANAASALETPGDYWRTHDLERLPEEFTYRIGELCKARRIESDDSDMNRLRDFRDRAMKNAGWIISASPLFDEETSYLVLSLVARGVPVSIVTSGNVVDKVTKDYSDDVKKILAFANFGLYGAQTDLGTPFILTDKWLYFSTYYRDGRTDLQTALVSDDPAAIQWGKDLFEYHRSRAVKVQV